MNYNDTRELGRTLSTCLPFNPEQHPERNGAVIIMVTGPTQGESLCLTVADTRAFAANLLALCDEVEAKQQAVDSQVQRPIPI